MIGFRVDSNEIIATGHFMRCKVIASELQSLGKKVLFICADETGYELALYYGFSAVMLHSLWNDLDGETEQLIKVIRTYSIEKLIIDSYQVTYEYLSTLDAVVPVIYIDDLNVFTYPVSILVNYNMYAYDMPYAEKYRDTTTKLLLGLDYLPLRQEFQGLVRENRSKVSNILISTGGSDPLHLAEELVTILNSQEEFQNTIIHVVLGKFSSFRSQNITHFSNIRLHRNVEKMAELMLLCDVAITAGGSTMYELCACGLPAVSFSFAENQLLGVLGMDRNNLIPYAGDFRLDEKKSLLRIVRLVRELMNDHEKRKNASNRMQGLVDGLGGTRFAKAIIILE